MSDQTRPRTVKGLALAGALRKSRSMPDPEVDWSAWIAAIEDEAAALSTTPAPDLDAAHAKVLALGCIRTFWGAARRCDDYNDGRDPCGICALRAALEGAPRGQ